jgi:energy-coupling factor transporter ATP-binding protein EcfA2
MTTATSMYALNHEQAVNAVLAFGKKRTVLIEGEMGIGKSSILNMLAERLPDHTPIYFDCTTRDLGDLMVPMFDKIGDDGVVKFAYNEELGS